MYCSGCGKQIDGSDKFCPYCGTKTSNHYKYSEQINNKTTTIKLVAIVGISLVIVLVLAGVISLNEKRANNGLLPSVHEVQLPEQTGNTSGVITADNGTGKDESFPQLVSMVPTQPPIPSTAPTSAETNRNGPPGAPQNVTIVGVESTKALVSWQVGDRAQSYEVEYYSRDYEAWRPDPDYVSGTSYTTTGLSRYSSYQYRVRSVNSAGNSDWVYVTYEKTTVAPSMPYNLEAVSYGSNSAMISWNAGAGANYYEVQYYSRADGVWKSDPDYSSGTSYVTTGLSKFESYQFRVRSVNEEGISDWATCTYYATSSAPNAPTNLTAERYGENSATISWTRSDHILYYEVQYYSVRNGKWMADEDYTSELSTSYVSTGLSNFDSYDYRVRAINSFGASAWATVTYYKPTSQSTNGGQISQSPYDHPMVYYLNMNTTDIVATFGYDYELHEMEGAQLFSYDGKLWFWYTSVGAHPESGAFPIIKVESTMPCSITDTASFSTSVEELQILAGNQGSQGYHPGDEWDIEYWYLDINMDCYHLLCKWFYGPCDGMPNDVAIWCS